MGYFQGKQLSHVEGKRLPPIAARKRQKEERISYLFKYFEKMEPNLF